MVKCKNHNFVHILFFFDTISMIQCKNSDLLHLCTLHSSTALTRRQSGQQSKCKRQDKQAQVIKNGKYSLTSTGQGASTVQSFFSSNYYPSQSRWQHVAPLRILLSQLNFPDAYKQNFLLLHYSFGSNIRRKQNYVQSFRIKST